MDAFWGVTLTVLIISAFYKREQRSRNERKAEEVEAKKRTEKQKQEEVIAQYSLVLAAPETKEEKEARKAAEQAELQREKDIAELRKQGFTDELITTIIPTINNGQ